MWIRCYLAGSSNAGFFQTVLRGKYPAIVETSRHSLRMIDSLNIMFELNIQTETPFLKKLEFTLAHCNAHCRDSKAKLNMNWLRLIYQSHWAKNHLFNSTIYYQKNLEVCQFMLWAHFSRWQFSSILYNKKYNLA